MRLRSLKDFRYQLFYRLLVRKAENLITYGNVCPWTIVPETLGPGSNVLCVGAGNDISFEKDLIRTFGCNVVLMDPSPTGARTFRRDGMNEPRLHFLPVALSDHDGEMNFAAPTDITEGSFRGVSGSAISTIVLPCKTLPTLISERRWDNIDLLKMDIEGSEYGVLGHALEHGLRIRQICVEFHHGPIFGHSRMETVRAILALRRAGYDLVHLVQWDHTFLLRKA